MFQKNRVSKVLMYRRGSIMVLSKIFCPEGPKNIVSCPFCVSDFFWYGKNLWIRDRGWGVSRFSVENSLTHSAKKFCGGTIQCFTKLRVSKNFMHKKRISLFSLDFFLSHSVEKIRKGTLPVWKIFKHRRRGGASRYFRKKFCLTS